MSHRSFVWRVACLTLLGVLMLAFLPVRNLAPVALADDPAPGAIASHPIVGAWYWENISDDPFDDSYAVFGDEGIYVEETSYIGGGIGSWQMTGPDSAQLLIVFQDIDGGLDPDRPAAFVPGTIRFLLDLKLSDDAGHFTATGPVEIRDVTGKLVDQFTFSGTATRFDVTSGLPGATPAAG
ncbi:MAG: hypothetical protein QM692_10025 [Thermomicrobiales bacterium]